MLNFLFLFIESPHFYVIIILFIIFPISCILLSNFLITYNAYYR